MEEREHRLGDRTRRREHGRHHERDQHPAARSRCATDPSDDQCDEEEPEDAVDADPIDRVDRVVGVPARMDREEALPLGAVPDRQQCERERNHDDVRHADEPTLEPRAQAPVGIREHGVRERDGEPELCEEEAEGEHHVVVAVLQLALEQAVRDQRHQDPHAVVRPPRPGDDAGEQERPRDDDARHGVLHGRVQVVAQQVVAVHAQ